MSALSYELRLNGRFCGEYATLEEALQRARAAVAADPDLDPEIMDRSTGRAGIVCGSRRWRDEITEKLGF
ncbi:MAG TPA: hypothetical protein VFA03_01265 [Acetobacteraceae bacterium]|nr:hypothetical protein [Acetobacteraceae bacterium]